MSENKRAHWGSKFGFILAASGSAIGLGNIWKFPYIAGINGGGAFVLVYLLCIAIVGVPVMLAEFIIGRGTQQNVVGAFRKLEKKRTPWEALGAMGMLSVFLILSFYSVVAGWILHYTKVAFTGGFSAGQDPDKIRAMLGGLIGNGDYQALLHFIFIAMTTGIVMGGVKKGIEKASDILMPVLFLILLIMLFYSMSLDGFKDALSFLFYPNFTKLTSEGILEGMGQAFFTLSVGVGTMTTYASYMRKDQELYKSAAIVAGLDTLIALLAGVVIFSIVFSFGLDAGGGPTLIFATLPALFTKITGGTILSIAFFILMTFAALSSSISMLEVIVAYIVDNYNIGRKKAAIMIGTLEFLVGLLSAYSYNKLADVKLPVKFLFGENLVFFDFFDKLVSNLMMPLGGMLFTIYVGWKLDKKVLKAQFTKSEQKLIPVLVFVLKFISPLLIGVVLLQKMNLLNYFLK